uniref:Uncharacterized protein n=1 Tax=Candidatus Kentrum sp. DK TaxID=2126562 RepID=A0A450SCF2_9GAMM|nr:MAG: hypothetical protein BECKDK2373C_GA0170839_102723 [Candidatus Kentron sp. DK]
MNSRLAGWPALEGLPEADVELKCQIGVWSKAPGAASDYRWIARTPGFVGDNRFIDNFYISDAPGKIEDAVLWKQADGYFHAVHLYSSPNRDSANRGNIIERVFVQCPAGVLPAVAVALLLLPEIARLGPELYQGHLENIDWRYKEKFIELSEDAGPSFHLGHAALLNAITRGMETVRNCRFDLKTHLGPFYAALLSGQQPCFLPDCANHHSLSPEMLAALLLPFPREITDKLSFAPDIPEGHVNLEKLFRNWNILPGRFAPPSSNLSAIEEEEWEAGKRLALSILHNDPEQLRKKDTQPVPRSEAPVEKPWINPIASMPIPDLPPDAGWLPRLLYEFAQDPQWRWLTDEHVGSAHSNDYALSPGTSFEFERTGVVDAENRWKPDVISRHPDDYYGNLQGIDTWLLNTIDYLRANAPILIDEKQWMVKLDILRSALMTLFPNTKYRIPLESKRIPSDYVASLLNTRRNSFQGDDPVESSTTPSNFSHSLGFSTSIHEEYYR